MTRALAIVDVQNDFTEGGALAVVGGDGVAQRVSSLLSRSAGAYDYVIASRDWHDPDNDNGGHFARGAEPDFVDTWPVHCVAGTAGAEYDELLVTDAIDIHVQKGQGKPAYSLFEGTIPDGTPASEVIGSLGIDQLDVVGIAIDYCVLRTALDALSAGLRVRVFDDLVAGVAPSSSDAALQRLREAGAVVLSSQLQEDETETTE